MFFKVEGDEVTEVLNKLAHVSIRKFNNEMMAQEVLIDYKECSEQEFTTAFSEAKERILTERS